MRLYYWIHHTGDYERNTGVQRVTRGLAAALEASGHELVPVRWSAEQEAIVLAEQPLISGFARFDGPVLAAHPEEGRPLHLASASSDCLDGAWLLLPEAPHVAGDDAPSLAVVLDYARFHGLRTAAVFYDLVPLRQPGYEAMAVAHEHYVRALVAADVAVAISAHSGQDLRQWWGDNGYDRTPLPPVSVAPLPAEIVGVPRVVVPDAPDQPVRFVALGTVEPRKNQVEVMRAFTRLVERRPDLDLRLDVVGGVHAAVKREVDELIARNDQIRLHGYVSDEEARTLVGKSHATVFMSLYEGFGLPITESLWLGKPCLCSDHGSMAEIAAGGGCLPVSARDGNAIEQALERLADDSDLRARLSSEATTRPLTSWLDYANAVVAAMHEAPLLRHLVLIDGSDSTEASALAVASNAARVSHLRWEPTSQALVPTSGIEHGASAEAASGLDVAWALVPGRADPTGLEALIDGAKGLGLSVALEADAAMSPELVASADLALFETANERDGALAAALRTLSRTVGVRDRYSVGTGGAAANAMRRNGRRLGRTGATARPTRVFYWVGLTVGQPFNTGVQRVTRSLGAGLQKLGVELVPVKWDSSTGAMAPISDDEAAHLAKWNGPLTRPRPLPAELAGEWLLVPEITVPVVPPGSNVARLGRSLGMRVAAVFYDVIPAKMPENYPRATLNALDEYWYGFEDVDLALPISWSVTADLQRWLASHGLRQPKLIPCPLAGDGGGVARVEVDRKSLSVEEPLRLLAIGTWEPRKNYPRLLRALAAAQAHAERAIELTIVGRRAGFDDLDAEIERLAVAANAVVHGHVGDEELEILHTEASATVFASWEEGFGLPVLESLWHGLPCLCHEGSAMAELVPGGGVLAVDMLDEKAIEQALIRLADEDGLLEQLGREAVARPIRTWDEYADDLLGALAQAGSPPGWPLPAIARRRPLLTCAITTYNRAPWLRHSLPLLIEAARPWRDVVEVVVCDNASTDETPDVMRQFRGEPNVSLFRNPTNLGMLGNLGATARASRGTFVWLLGDDDLLIEGALENVLEGLARHPDVEMAYLNYAYTQFDDPSTLDDPAALVAQAIPIAPGSPNRYVKELREVAGLTENIFTAIYTCVFRRDHALRAYQLDTRGAPFTSLATCVPSSVYALAALQDRPAWWVGDPALVVNMNVSWLRWALLWHLERMPDLFEEAERRGVDPERLDVYRLKHLAEAERWVRTTYFEAEDAIRENFSLARLLERSKHLTEFRERHLKGIRRAYAEAWDAGRVVVDPVPPDELFSRYGLQE